MSKTIGRSLKSLHEIGAIGTLGSFGACIVLLTTAPTESPVAFAAVMQGISSTSKWLPVPSLAIVLISGLLAIAADEAHMDAVWAWVKALLGIGTFEGTMLTVTSSARHATELSALAVSSGGEPAQLAQVLRTEWGGLRIMVALAFINIVRGVGAATISAHRQFIGPEAITCPGAAGGVVNRQYRPRNAEYGAGDEAKLLAERY